MISNINSQFLIVLLHNLKKIILFLGKITIFMFLQIFKTNLKENLIIIRWKKRYNKNNNQMPKFHK